MKLKIGTFNVAAGLQPNTHAIAQMLAKLNLQLVGLQEVDQKSKRNPKDMLQEIAGTHFANQSFQATLAFADGGHYGLGSVSQLKAQTYQAYTYQVTGEEERVFQFLTFELAPGKFLGFYNTHLSFESPAIRAQQVEELKAHLKVHPCEWTVIVGDFNFDQSYEEWALFEEFQWVNGGAHPWQPTFLAPDATMQVFAIDNILTSLNVTIEQIEKIDTNCSDHALLWAELDFEMGKEG